MKKRLLLVMLSCYCIQASSQDDLDEIFDDDVSDSHIAVGTDLITDFSGTINVYANIRPLDFFRAQVGIGFLPFGRYTDFMNIPRSEEFPVRDTMLTGGFYYSAAMHLVRETSFPGFDYSYYFDYKHWSYTAQSVYDLKRLKACFGIAYAYRIPGGLSFDAHIGVYLAREKVTANDNFVTNAPETYYHGMYFDEAGDIQSAFLNGFDFGIGVNYNFNL